MTNTDQSGPIDTLPPQWTCPLCGYGEYKNRDDWQMRFADHLDTLHHEPVEPEPEPELPIPAGQTLAQYLKQLQAETERLRDLVRFSRFRLYAEHLITTVEYTQLCQVIGTAVRLDGYRELRDHLDAADREIRKLINQRDEARTEIIEWIRNQGHPRIADALTSVHQSDMAAAKIDISIKSSRPPE